MRRGTWTPEGAHDLVMAWAATATRFESKTLPNYTTIQQQLGLDNFEALTEYVRTRIVGRDDDEIQARIPCHTWGTRGFKTTTVATWRAGLAVCHCRHCDNVPTVGDMYPRLLELMVRPNPHLPVTSWAEFYCPNQVSLPDHEHPWLETSPQRIADGWVCRVCFIRQQLHAAHQPGDLIADTKRTAALNRTRLGPTVTKREQAVVAALIEAFGADSVITDKRILLAVDAACPTPSVKPDAILPGARTVVEIDGGTGSSAYYSAHDTVAGVARDELRDVELLRVGWRTVRVRHNNALPLKSSATIVADNGRCPAAIAADIRAAT